MAILWCLTVSVIIAMGIYLMLERHLLRVLFGFVLLSNSVNLCVFICGRLTRESPALIREDVGVPIEQIANPLPQALVLTAIVISFGLFIFLLLLAYRLQRENNSGDVDQLNIYKET